MSIAAADTTPSRTDSPQGPVRREPFYLTCTTGPLFAWLHQPSATARDHAVVICPPVGFEQLHAHRGLRHLADRLAEKSLPTLRFDWHGTGDSTGDDRDPDRCDTWQANVRSAVRWVKQELGCQRVSVVGLRLGALLASLALDGDEVENLVLWAPVINGRGYVREMSAIDLTSETPSQPTEPGTIEAAGFCLTSAAAAELSRCSLFQANPQCRHLLISGRDGAPDQRAIEHFKERGIAVDQLPLPGVAAMLVEPHKSQVPDLAIEQIADWLDTHPSNGPRPPQERRAVRLPSLRTLAELQVGSLQAPVRETAIPVDSSPNLFGILSEPVDPADADLPGIVLLNGGAAYRIGPGRMNVELARRFSAQGFRCLRLDLGGLGDSISPDQANENDSYASTAFRDIEITLQQLRNRCGIQRFVLMGLCSGAYDAFQSAAQLNDPGLIESVLINPLTFFWCDGMTLESAATRELIREHYYLHSALQPRKWLKLVSGRSQIGIRGALRLVARRLGLARRSRRRPEFPAAGGAVCHRPSHPIAEDLTSDLKQIVAKRRHLTMVFSTTDPGYSILTAQAGRQAKRMQRGGHLDLQFIDGADHTFSRQTARQKLIESLSDALRRRYQPSKPSHPLALAPHRC